MTRRVTEPDSGQSTSTSTSWQHRSDRHETHCFASGKYAETPGPAHAPIGVRPAPQSERMARRAAQSAPVGALPVTLAAAFRALPARCAAVGALAAAAFSTLPTVVDAVGAGGLTDAGGILFESNCF